MELWFTITLIHCSSTIAADTGTFYRSLMQKVGAFRPDLDQQFYCRHLWCASNSVLLGLRLSTTSPTMALSAATSPTTTSPAMAVRGPWTIVPMPTLRTADPTRVPESYVSAARSPQQLRNIRMVSTCHT